MDWEDIKDLIAELAIYIWCFGMGILFFYHGYSRIGNIYIPKHKRTGVLGNPYEADWLNSIPLWFAGAFFISIGIYALYNNRIKK